MAVRARKSGQAENAGNSQSVRAPDRKPRAEDRTCHAFVGGWLQRRGDFVGLLLGVRQGRQRKLTYIGAVKTNPDGLEMTLLGPRLRESEIEASPFVDEPPAHPNHTCHWINPDLVAEIEIDGWTRDAIIKSATLKAVTDRASFRRANWAMPPKRARAGA